jgi:mannose-6-phosphate isomerase-like protein (cupin superfamily)
MIAFLGLDPRDEQEIRRSSDPLISCEPWTGGRTGLSWGSMLSPQIADRLCRRAQNDMKLISLIPLLGMLVLQGNPPAVVHVWKATDIHSKGEALAKKLDENKSANEPIATGGSPTFLIAHREGSGLSEVHDTETDIIVISEGKVTMVYGGTMVGGKVTAPGQSRGSGITGGTEVQLGPGDIIHIPAAVPHQMKLAPGVKLTYFVAKVLK